MSLRRAASSKACVPPIQKPIVATAPSTSGRPRDRKSTRLNSSHSQISYAVFCLKKKKNLPLMRGASADDGALPRAADVLSTDVAGLSSVANIHGFGGLGVLLYSDRFVLHDRLTR